MEGLIFGGAYLRRGLSTEGNLRFKIDLASLIVGRKFTDFALFYFVFEANFQVQAPRGGGLLYLEGPFNGGFFALQIWGLIFGGAYTRRGLFSEFYGIALNYQKICILSETLEEPNLNVQFSKAGTCSVLEVHF